MASGYYGEQVTVTTPRQGNPHRETVRVYRRGSTLRIDYPNNRVLFDDGSTELLFFAARVNVPGVVERSPSKLGPKAVANQRRIISGNRAMVTLLPDDTVAGRPTWVVQVQDAMGRAPSRKIWVDKETSLQLRQDITLPVRAVSTYFTSITFQSPPAEKLTFTPPPGTLVDEEGDGGVLHRPIQPRRAEEIARTWGGHPVTPGYLPAGFIFRGFYLHKFNNQDVLVSVFADGGMGRGHKLTIFQGPASMGMPTAGAVSNKNVHALNARKGVVDVTVVSPLGEAELRKVMDSIPVQ